mgnify:CR=1 FL=1
MVYQTLSSRRQHRQPELEVDGTLRSSAEIIQTPSSKSNGHQLLKVIVEHDKASNKKAVISL